MLFRSPFGRRLEPLRLEGEGHRLYYEGITKNSRLTAACGCSHRVSGSGCETGWEFCIEELEGTAVLTAEAKEGCAVVLEKMLCYSTDLDLPAEDLKGYILDALEEAEQKTFGGLEKSQKAYMGRFWDTADIRIQGKDSQALQQGLRFNLFQDRKSVV